MATALLWPAFGGMAVVAGPLIRTVYGPAGLPAAAPLALLALASTVLI
jgi:O-antigen/teichoic acid export membrane protein